MPSVIRVGCRVSGNHGELYLPDGAGEGGKRVRRVRRRIEGTVTASISGQKWRVMWDNGDEDNYSPRTLKYVGPGTGTVSTRTSDETAASSAVSTSVHDGASTIRTDGSNDGTRATSSVPSLLAGCDDSSISSDEEEDRGEVEEAYPSEDSFWVHNVPDAEELRKGEELNIRMVRYQREKASLIGKVIEVGPARGTKVNWRVREDVTADEIDLNRENEQLGIRGLQMKYTADVGDVPDPDVSPPRAKRRSKGPLKRSMKFLPILQHLWPGDWRQHRLKLNLCIQEHNKEEARRGVGRSGTKSKTRYVREVSEHEFWVFIGVLLAAVGNGSGGTTLWHPDSDNLFAQKSMDEYMKEYRFKEIRKFWPYIFHDPDREGKDEWWRIISLIEDFNENRRHTVAASIAKILDEVMSAFRPQTRKTGNLPHLTYLQRKPEDLGTEFKNACCVATGIFIYLELQRGKDQMTQQPHYRRYGATAACSIRLCGGAKECGQKGEDDEESSDEETPSGSNLTALHSEGTNDEGGDGDESVESVAAVSGPAPGPAPPGALGTERSVDAGAGSATAALGDGGSTPASSAPSSAAEGSVEGGAGNVVAASADGESVPLLAAASETERQVEGGPDSAATASGDGGSTPPSSAPSSAAEGSVEAVAGNVVAASADGESVPSSAAASEAERSVEGGAGSAATASGDGGSTPASSGPSTAERSVEGGAGNVVAASAEGESVPSPAAASEAERSVEGSAGSAAAASGDGRSAPAPSGRRARFVAGVRLRRRRRTKVKRVRRDLFMGDSWFTGVKTIAAIALLYKCEFIGVIKTSHGYYPKKWLEDTMREYPPGSHIVLEGVYEGVTMIAVGYKYNGRKVQLFLMSKGADVTTPGVPYEAKWMDENGNTRTRNIARPKMATTFYSTSDEIDSHNHLRQGELALEKMWVTEDGYFRIFTSILGICLTDGLRGYLYSMPRNHPDEKMTIKNYCGVTAKECLENTYSDNVGEVTYLPPLNETSTPSPASAVGAFETGAMSSISSVTMSLEDELGVDPHQKMECVPRDKTKLESGKVRTKRTKCIVCKEEGRGEVATMWECSVCHCGICKDGSGGKRGNNPEMRNCESAHKKAMAENHRARLLAIARNRTQGAGR